jgi:glycosyltransferase involved in cell wall biosynthesis
VSRAASSSDGIGHGRCDVSRAGSQLIVQVVPSFPPHIGGAENVAKTISEGLADSGPVEVLTSRSGAGTAPRLDRRGRMVVRRLLTIEVAHVPFMPSLLLHLLRLPRRAMVHVHIAQAYVPEMVWLASVLRRRSYVAHFHLDVDPSGCFGRLFVAYKRWILGPVLRSAARVIVVSSDQPDFLRRRYGVAQDRIVSIPNGVGPEFFREPREAPNHGGPFRLLFAGRLAPQKNVSLLLRAVAAMSVPVELVLVGDGEERAMLERLAAALGLSNTRMVGAVVGEDLVRWYCWADALVLTSHKESTGLVLLEAMAAGTPVVATKVVGITDTVGDAGLLAPPEPDAFAAAVEQLAADPELWADLSRRGYARAMQQPLWAQLVRTLKDVYEEVAVANGPNLNLYKRNA